MANLDSPEANLFFYLIQALLIALAGFLVLPLYTKVLGLENYSSIVLVDSVINLILPIIQAGLPQSTVRFYWPLKGQNRELDFYVTQISTALCLGLVIEVLIEFIMSWFSSGELLRLMRIGVFSVLFLSLFEVVLSFDRASQKGIKYSIGHVLSRYVGLFVGLGGYFIFNDIFGIYIARILSFLVLIFIFLRKPLSLFRLKNFDLDLMKTSLAYGLPLIFVGLQGAVLTFGDRYLLAYFYSKEMAGIYSAAYSLGTGMSAILVTPFNLFAQPFYLRELTESGERRTKELLNKLTGFYFLVSGPLFASVMALGTDFLLLLTNRDYLEGKDVFSWVLVGMILYGLSFLTGAGLYIAKKTKLILYSLTASVILNLFSNLFLIPSMGLNGAAIATFLSYAFYAILVSFLGAKFFSFRLAWRKLFKVLILSILMARLMFLLNGHTFLSLIISGISGIVFYLGTMILIDKDVRLLFSKVRELLKQRFILIKK